VEKKRIVLIRPNSNECKRRKIKCNGNQPCQRCGNLNIECVYASNCCGSNFRDSEYVPRALSDIVLPLGR